MGLASRTGEVRSRNHAKLAAVVLLAGTIIVTTEWCQYVRAAAAAAAAVIIFLVAEPIALATNQHSSVFTVPL